MDERLQMMSGMVDLEPDPIGAQLGTGFHRFEHKRRRIGGLCKHSNGRFELLAIVSHDRRKGHFRWLIRELQKSCTEIYAWHVDNPIAADALARYGFVATQIYEDGEPISGMMWART